VSRDGGPREANYGGDREFHFYGGVIGLVEGGKTRAQARMPIPRTRVSHTRA